MYNNSSSNMSCSIWVARIIPLVLMSTAGFSSYVIVGVLSVNYLLIKEHASGAAVSILVPYFILAFLTMVSFLRLIYMTYFNPPFVPLGRGQSEGAEKTGRGGNSIGREESGSTGLDLFYHKDVFVVDHGGRPWWCSTCGNWKPDRAHHCSRSGRCVKKMDHFCPWVGGPIGENNFKFFIQFTSYGAIYCTYVLTVLAVYVSKLRNKEEHHITLLLFITIGLASVFLLFSGGMSLGSIRLALKNLTQVEMRGAKSRVYTLAIHVSSRERIDRIYDSAQSYYIPSYITYPLQACDDSYACNPDIFRSSSKVNPNFSETLHHYIPNPTSNLDTQILQPITTKSDTNNSNTYYQSPLSTELNKISANPTEKREELGTLSPGILDPAEKDVDLQEKFDHTIGSPTVLGSQETLANSNNHRPLYRTFAITRTKPGENPWDLGSMFLNWKSVMGENVFDWLLPIRSSPCCVHDNPESLYQVGIAVNNIRSNITYLDSDIPNRKV